MIAIIVKQPAFSKGGHILCMHGLANHAQRGFEIAVGRFESIGVNGEWRTEHDERCAILAGTGWPAPG
jgi:hypothetical protein